MCRTFACNIWARGATLCDSMTAGWPRSSGAAITDCLLFKGFKYSYKNNHYLMLNLLTSRKIRLRLTSHNWKIIDFLIVFFYIRSLVENEHYMRLNWNKINAVVGALALRMIYHILMITNCAFYVLQLVVRNIYF